MKKLTLALDIGNVCIRIDKNNCFRALGIKVPPPEMLSFAEKFECGQISRKSFFENVQKYLPGKHTAAECLNAFNSILIEAVPGMEELVSSLETRGVHPVFFSDISEVHIERTRELFSAAKYVTDGIYSYQTGALKPSPVMLNAFEKSYGRPDLYVDDRADLIAKAREFGWNAVRFTAADQLSRELDRLAEKSSS